ncbi:MAG: pre-peptidase C-terminal domain-containing protein, partial [Phycisphaerae bacterium]
MALEPRVLLSARHDPFGAGTFPAVGVGCRPDGVSAPPLDPGASNVPAAGPAIPAEDSPLSAVPLLHSRPAATVKLYLDFDGDVPTASWGGYSVPATPAYDTDGNAAAFSDTELSAVRQMWARVAEKYAPFNIDVTTAAPPALTNKVAFRIVVGGDGAWYGGGGGVTWANSFSNFQPNTGYVFSKNLANGTFEFVAEAAAHEAGHGFGLQHQSIYNGTTIANEYNPGNSLVAPVMGSSYYAARGVWWLGPNNLSSTTIQDDLSVLNNAANAFRYAGDDYGSTAATAGALPATGGTLAAAGVIEQAADLDYFSFTAATAGQASFTANVGSYVRAETGSSAGATLDLALELRDAGGNLIASADTSALGETFTANLPVAGTYYLVVRSHGAYGDLGTYVVDGTFQPARVVSTPANVVGQRGQFVSVPIAVDNAAGIRSFNLSLVYDTTLVDLATADVTAGALLPPGWS